MRKILFQIHCIQFYSRHIKKTGTKVYALFMNSGLLDLLNNDYDRLHVMEQEALIKFFDKYLAEKLKK